MTGMRHRPYVFLFVVFRICDARHAVSANAHNDVADLL